MRLPQVIALRELRAFSKVLSNFAGGISDGKNKGKTPRERKHSAAATDLKQLIAELPPKEPVAVSNALAVKGTGVRNESQGARKQLGRKRGKRRQDGKSVSVRGLRTVERPALCRCLSALHRRNDYPPLPGVRGGVGFQSGAGAESGDRQRVHQGQPAGVELSPQQNSTEPLPRAEPQSSPWKAFPEGI